MTTEEQKPEPQKEPGSVFGVPMATVFTAGAGIIGKVLEASPLGIAAASVFAFAGFFIIRSLIKKFNASIDRRDDANAGKMVGQGAVDLRNQAEQVKHELDFLQNAAPPKKEDEK